LFPIVPEIFQIVKPADFMAAHRPESGREAISPRWLKKCDICESSERSAATRPTATMPSRLPLLIHPFIAIAVPSSGARFADDNDFDELSDSIARKAD
jgi:hypothetical protein